MKSAVAHAEPDHGLLHTHVCALLHRPFKLQSRSVAHRPFPLRCECGTIPPGTTKPFPYARVKSRSIVRFVIGST